MTNAHSETGQMAVCCQNLPLGWFSSCSAPFVLVGALFKKFGLFLNTPCTLSQYSRKRKHKILLETYNEYDPNATRQSVLRKINSLCSAYNKEYKKFK
jgi:hypothetical protein